MTLLKEDPISYSDKKTQMSENTFQKIENKGPFPYMGMGAMATALGRQLFLLSESFSGYVQLVLDKLKSAMFFLCLCSKQQLEYVNLFKISLTYAAETFTQ